MSLLHLIKYCPRLKKILKKNNDFLTKFIELCVGCVYFTINYRSCFSFSYIAVGGVFHFVTNSHMTFTKVVSISTDSRRPINCI